MRITDPDLGKWLRRVTWAGFWFFLIKGMIWLIALAGIWVFADRCG